MNLHEYQAKSIFAKWGLPVPKNVVCSSIEEVGEAFDSIALNGKAVVKCQVHAGGRGKAGGVKVVTSKQDAKDFAEKWLGKNLVTFQTDAKGQPINKILVEECKDVVKEYYIGATIDRSRERLVFMASTEGGMEIEKVAAEHPEKIFKEIIDPTNGPQPYQGRELSFKLGLDKDQSKQFIALFTKMCKMYLACDCSLLEVNPLVLTSDGNLLCLDAKMNVDNNALYRQKEIQEMRDLSQEPKIEAEAQSNNLNYVALDGNIGCMVNGAGLAMGTMDIIKLYGGEPANFLDVGGSATKERVIKAFELILGDPKVKVIFVNIFGGIVKCDLIAEGIVGAVDEVGIKIPVVVRLEGNGAEKAAEILQQSGLNIIANNDLASAAQAAVKALGE